MQSSLIVPIYNRYDLVHNLLYDLRNSLPIRDDIEIVLVNDASTEERLESGLAWWQKSGIALHKIRYIKNDENLGFGGTCNRGARIAKGEVLVFISTDVQVRGDFLTPLLGILREKEALVGGEVIDWKAGWNELTIRGKPAFVPYANGWLLGCRRETWERLGGFDPIYGKFDVEDLDLSTQALALNIPLVALRSPYVKHLSGQSISTLAVNRYNITEQNREKWLAKWEHRFNGGH